MKTLPMKDDPTHNWKAANGGKLDCSKTAGFKTPYTMKTETETLAPNWCFIGIDELRHWRLPDNLIPYVTGIISTYAFNRSVQTHCCELTPSYWLDFIGHEAVTTLETPDDIRDEISNFVMGEPGDGQYFHCSAVDRMAAKHPELYYDLGCIEDDADGDGVTPPDAVRECWNRSPRF